MRVKNEKILAREAEEKKVNERCEEYKRKGIYRTFKYDPTEEYINVELSEDERYNREFDAKRLAKTFGVDEKDLWRFNSDGKTYLFLKNEKGNYFQFFHPYHSDNPLSIHVTEMNEEEKAKFIEEWRGTAVDDKETHFVC